MRRLVVLGTLLVLAGCGGGADPATTPTVSVTPTPTPTASTPQPTATTATAVALGEVDVYTCQQFVADAGEAYDFLTTVVTEGSVSVDFGTPGYLEAYGVGGLASVYTGQQESPALFAAMGDVVAAGGAFKTAVDARESVDAGDVRDALDRAAEVCEEGGFIIDWN